MPFHSNTFIYLFYCCYYYKHSPQANCYVQLQCISNLWNAYAWFAVIVSSHFPSSNSNSSYKADLLLIPLFCIHTNQNQFKIYLWCVICFWICFLMLHEESTTKNKVMHFISIWLAHRCFKIHWQFERLSRMCNPHIM